MPKVSDEHKERRREEILVAAERCFAKHGYEGATVAKLEKESGLSRGAIFNYFENKQALFVELAVRTSRRVVDVWLEHGFRAALEAITAEDPDWLAVQLEATRRVRTDKAFRAIIKRHERAHRAGRPERLERLRAQGVREDIPVEDVARFLGLVANGLALQRSAGEELLDLDAVVELVESGVAPRPTRRERAPRRRAVRPSRGRRG